MYGIAGLLLLGAVVVQLIAPERANVEMPTRRNGRGQIDVGLWAGPAVLFAIVAFDALA